MPDGVSETSVVLIDELNSGESAAVALDDNVSVPAMPDGVMDTSVVFINKLSSGENGAVVLDDNA